MRIRGVDKFVFYGRDHADGGVEAVVVVPAADPHGDFLAGLGSGGLGAPVDELVLEGGEERLGRSVVQGVAGSSGGSVDSDAPTGFGESFGRVLAGFNRSLQHRGVGEGVGVR